MPTYEYQCSSCGNQWEELQKISEPALDTCPKCAQKSAQRLISGGNFILKGGGWYSDLYASSGNKSASKPAAATETSSSAPAASPAPAAAPAASAPSSGSSGGGSSST